MTQHFLSTLTFHSISMLPWIELILYKHIFAHILKPNTQLN